MSDEEKINRIFNEIEMKSSEGEYIYRGEPEDYHKVTSNLYRQYQDNIKEEDFDIRVVQESILVELREYPTLKNKSDTDILDELQHYGGSTNFIDFTKDYHVAIFFACNGSPEECGRVILKRKADTKEYTIHQPRIPQNRIIAQKSIFIYPEKGWIEPQEDELIFIPANLKKSLLDKLSKFYDISTATIYNDLHGYIKNKKIHKNAYTEFYMGMTSGKKASEEKNPSKRKIYFENSIKNFNKAIQLNPQLEEAYNNRGVTKGNFGDSHGAINDFSKAIEINPQLADAYKNRGKAKSDIGEHQKSIIDFDKAIELNPQSDDAYYNRGVAKTKLNEHRRAIADYSKAIELNPRHVDAYFNRASARERIDELHGALNDYDKAVEINPQSIETYNNRGIVKGKLGKYHEAITDYNKVIKINPKLAVSYFGRGLAKAQLHDSTAKKDLEKALLLAKTQGETEIAKNAQQILDELKKLENLPPTED